MQEAQGTYNRKARVFMYREIDVKIKIRISLDVLYYKIAVHFMYSIIHYM